MCVSKRKQRVLLGTLMPGLLAGHRRYAHITAPRGDAVSAQALGMNRIVSVDALWGWYCRAANTAARMEAITSRPLLLAAVDRATHRAGQTTL